MPAPLTPPAKTDDDEFFNGSSWDSNSRLVPNENFFGFKSGFDRVLGPVIGAAVDDGFFGVLVPRV